MPAHELSAEKREKMLDILNDLKQRMREIDKLGKKIKEERTAVSPQRTKQLLQEIKVPSLKLLKETG